MKKFYLILTLFITLLFNVNHISADSISKYYMNATILNNGDVEVEEYIDLNGDYNGYERIIKYGNEKASVFDINSNSLGGNQYHDAKNIKIVSVKGVDKTNNNIDTLFKNLTGDEFKQTFHSTVGSYGEYTTEETYQGIKLRIYNPRKAFYIKYIIEDLGILYNDYGEIGWNIFTEQREDIDDFKLKINIPNNKNELKAWAHGQLTGNIELSGKNNVYVTIKDYDASYPFDVRVLFDRENIINSTKIIQIDALDKILNYENEKAAEANKIREKYRKIAKNVKKIDIILIIILLLLMTGTYFRFDKEHKAFFKHKYYRDFPSDISPSTVEYLTKKEITTNSLSAIILNLIYKKVIKFTKISMYDYKLELIDNCPPVTLEEIMAIKFVFDDHTVTQLSYVKARGTSDYETVIKRYHLWKSHAIQKAKSYNYFINSKVRKVLLTILGLIIIFGDIFILMKIYKNILNIILLIIAIIFIIYTIKSTKKTKKGIEEYNKWIALKRFLNDFGRFSNKDLPQITLWEKYLVYATVFGLAKKLSREMEIKIKSNPSEYNSFHSSYQDHTFEDIISFNDSISNSIESSYTDAHNAKTAESRNSSGGGFGGGFSSGGGSFGGGGGGGRF